MIGLSFYFILFGEERGKGGEKTRADGVWSRDDIFSAEYNFEIQLDGGAKLSVESAKHSGRIMYTSCLAYSTSRRVTNANAY